MEKLRQNQIQNYVFITDIIASSYVFLNDNIEIIFIFKNKQNFHSPIYEVNANECWAKVNTRNVMNQKDSRLKCDFTKSHKSNQVSIYELQRVLRPQYTKFKSTDAFQGKPFIHVEILKWHNKPYASLLISLFGQSVIPCIHNIILPGCTKCWRVLR